MVFLLFLADMVYFIQVTLKQKKKSRISKRKRKIREAGVKKKAEGNFAWCEKWRRLHPY